MSIRIKGVEYLRKTETPCKIKHFAGCFPFYTEGVLLGIVLKHLYIFSIFEIYPNLVKFDESNK